ncbi:MAG: 16S rRNA (adenine(1518)-N(6)/adenine(1519)-N(6))-dimethyltransferase RsmA [Planctomycetota bacterium]
MSGGSPRPPWAELRAALAAAGFRPTRGRGQNFLLDGNMLRAIARDSGVGAGDFVLEVGAGSGALSLELARRGVHLLAIEIDRRLLAVAARALSSFPAVALLAGDVLAGKHALAPAVAARLPAQGPWHLVANLPYSIAGPLLMVLARLPRPPQTMSVLVQREVALRIAADPGESGWGGLAAKLAPRYRRRRGRRVPPQLFWPRPRVESEMVHLDRAPEGAEPRELVAYDRLVDGLFRHRRKVLRRSLGDLLGDGEAARTLLEEAGVDGGARVEVLGPAELLRLAGSPRWAPPGDEEGR